MDEGGVQKEFFQLLVSWECDMHVGGEEIRKGTERRKVWTRAGCRKGCSNCW